MYRDREKQRLDTTSRILTLMLAIELDVLVGVLSLVSVGEGAFSCLPSLVTASASLGLSVALRPGRYVAQGLASDA